MGGLQCKCLGSKKTSGQASSDVELLGCLNASLLLVEGIAGTVENATQAQQEQKALPEQGQDVEDDTHRPEDDQRDDRVEEKV